MLMLDNQEIFRIVITKPDRDSEKEWLFPSFWWWWYYILLRFTLIAVQCAFCGMAYFFAKELGLELSIGQSFVIMVGVAFGCQLFLMIACITVRITYETVILLFHTFRGTRDTVTAIEKVGNVLSSMSQVQISSGQYVCDRLAEVCDELKGVKDEA